ncbi:hypothetical protein AMELA_G00125280, partial [Ameiurus melas]
MKRPWPGGLSELIKGAHVKVKRISLEKIHNGSSQQMNIDGLVSKVNNVDVASKDCTSENMSIPDVTKEGTETVSFSKNSDSSTIKNTTKSFSPTNMQCKLNKTTSNAPLNEKVTTILGETETLTDEKLSSEETSQCVVKPLDCGGEVKKKRAEPVPLPLLALFLQQLKSKTRPTRPKPKSEACSVSSQSDKSCHDTSVAENILSSTASFTPSLDTQLNVQPAVSPTSQTITTSILTCTVASTEHEMVSTPNSATDAVTAMTASIVRDTLQLSTNKKVSATTSAFVHNVKPHTSFSDTTHNTKIVSVTLDDASPGDAPSCDPKVFPATTPDAPSKELLHSNVTTEKNTTEPAHDCCTVPCPEAVPWSPSPGVKTQSSPSCAPSSPYMSAPSSPDPFPPSMFSDRPIPPRKTLDPFPPCLSLDRPRPLLELADPLPHTFFTKATPPEDPSPAVFSITSEVNCPVVSPDPNIPKELKPSLKTSKGTKRKVKQKKSGKTKLSEDVEVTEVPVPVPMQPNLEDVEGQLFVSFMSKKALEIHLGDEAKEDIVEKTTENIEDEVHDEEERINALEKVLLRDLTNMKNRQVIHPVLQAVGLKLNLLDVTLSIDLQYLGVCLPIPPPIHLPEGSSGTCSSQVHFVSRTGKTTDITKIKGWREKFSTSSSSVPRVITSSDTGQKNLSAFCSDMLDEYLESEGKLIDERAASFSQAVVTPVAYQLPTKSTSYVRTLDSVLKKQAPPLACALSEPSVTFRKTMLNSKRKKAFSGLKTKKSMKAENPVSSTDKKSGESSSKKSKSNISKSGSSAQSAAPALSQSKKSSKVKTKKGSKPSQDPFQTSEKPAKDIKSAAPAGQNASSSPGSHLPVGRSSGLPKTLVKLRDVEDGAVWEGKHRTYITMERAAIALSCLVTAEGTIRGSSSTVIKRRAPPCLNDFCRLGCVCASLVQERRQHHCGKPQCMLGCDCLRRRVVLLKNEDMYEESAPVNDAEENSTKVKKKKNRISYILSGTDAAPEPALHIKTLWVQQNDSDSEQLFIPDPARPLHPRPQSLDLQKDLENFLHSSPKRAAVRAVDGEGLIRVKNQESLDCARVRPFCGRKLSPCRQRSMKDGHPDHGSQDSLHEMEEGELRPPTLSGPSKRLEIVSKCKWATEDRRNVILRTVCERMSQDCLKHPFWIGKYQIQPTSKTIKETDEGSIITYKVVISQPQVEESEEKKEQKRINQLEAQLIETIGKSEVKGLPLLSPVTPAGLLKAEKKPSGALGQIMVNGKLYPQAKLELGQMGALHPANRLAAYITGRVCVANKHDPKAVTTATKTDHTASTTPTSVATTTVTSTLSSAVTLDKPTVSINMRPKASIASHASSATGTTDGSIQVVKAVTGSAASEKSFVLSTTGSNVALSGSGIRLMQPLTSACPAVPGQRIVMLKAANPAGRVIRFVPLGQFRALNPNIVVHPQQATLIRLPTHNPVPLSKSQTSTTAASTTAPSSATQDQHMAPAQSITRDTITTSGTSPIATKPVTPLSGSKTLLFCNKPSTVKILPGFLRDTATSTLRILPRKAVESTTVKYPRNTSSASSAQSSSEGHPENQGLQLTSQSCLTPKNQESHKSDNSIHTSPTPTKESCDEDSQCSKMSPENVIFTDHSYTFEMKTSTPSKKIVDVSKESSDPENSSTYHMLLKEVLDLGPVEEVESCGTIGAVLGTESDVDSKAESHLMEEDVNSDCTELTEDSDMYIDTDSSHSSDQEDLCVVSDSDREEKNKKKREFIDAQVQNLTEMDDDDELVDIETCEDGAEKISALSEQMLRGSFQNQSSDEATNENLLKLRKRKDEKRRRVTLRNCFQNLQQALNIEDAKVPKITLLSEALEEINRLTKRGDHLVKMWDKLRKKRAYYVEMASQISGKNKASISQKLDEIIAKQKSLEIEEKGNDTSLNLKKIVPKHLHRNVNAKQKKTGTKDKAENLSISKQKHLGFKGRRTENISTNQKMTAAKPTDTCPTPQLGKCPSPSPILRERRRPNILSRSNSQTLANDQVIPLVETVVPCNQIITISNPLQPIDLTSLGERQSTTPGGVATVSISLPRISHPLCVENPPPVLQPQVLKLTNSLVTTPVDISLPKFSSIVSLVQSEKLLVTPPSAADMQTQAACNSTAWEAQQNPSFDEPTLEEEKHLDKQLPEVVPKKPENDSKVTIEEDPKKQKEDEKNTPKPEQDDDRLMSLLDELDFLSQTSELQEAASSLTEEDVLTDLLTNKEVDMDRDDERSLSPLFLKLDEDLVSPTSKDEEIEDIPPKVDDLVKVIFG